VPDSDDSSPTPQSMKRAAPRRSSNPPPNQQVERVLRAMCANGPGVNANLQRTMAVVIRHLHAMLDELQIGEPELIRVYEFLDRVGTNKDTMLLGDHLGLSMRANDIAYYDPKGTAPNLIGPLYRENAPFMENPGSMVAPDEPGQHIHMHGMLRDCDTGMPLPGAVLDFWQTNAAGFYEDQDPNLPDYHFRRRIRTDENGRYAFRTIIPGGYYIANRGTPVVELTQALGLGSFRAPHIHLMVDAEGYRHLTTLIYFEGEEANDSDCIFSCRPENTARIVPSEDGDLPDCLFDIDLVRP